MRRKPEARDNVAMCAGSRLAGAGFHISHSADSSLRKRRGNCLTIVLKQVEPRGDRLGPQTRVHDYVQIEFRQTVAATARS